MIAILFENEDLLAVDKPEGIVSLSKAGEGGLQGLLASERAGKLYAVHRLDKEVSGAIVFAKNRESHRYMNMAFDRRSVRKTYSALVHGRPEEFEGTIDTPLRAFGSGRMGIDPEQGKPSRTRFSVSECFGAYSLLNIYPETGRRHQIRVHLYSLGHAVVGDMIYGDKNVQRRFPRLMLHARELAFVLPSGENIEITTPPPESFHRVLASLKRAR